MYFHVYSFKLQIHAHIYRSFIRHHKMLGVRIAKRKTSLKSRAKANPCGTKLRTRIFFVNTLQKETPPTRVVFLFGALSICAANRPPAATFIEKRRETREGFPRKHPLPREERRILHSSDEKNLLPTPMREAHFNQRWGRVSASRA